MKIRSLVGIPFILILSFILIYMSGCNAVENVSQSVSILIIEAITGADLEGNPDSTTVFSDVITTSGTVFNDNGTASLSSELINPGQVESTYYHDIIVDQIDIEYTRSDGLTGQGVDVPYSFSQRVNLRVPIGEGVFRLSFILIQHTAKMESPLVELINVGQEHVLKLEAHITFHGRDLGGHRIDPVTGTISVWCSNFGDDD